MRFVATMFLWLVTTVLLAVAVPTMWAQRNVVSEDGYAALSAAAAQDPKLQRAMASELTAQIRGFAADNGYGTLNTELVGNVVTAYTGNDGFPGQFAQANRIAHRWMFTDTVGRRTARATVGSSTSRRCSTIRRSRRRSAISTWTFRRR